MTYTEFISQFEVFENPPKKKGLHRHHIVPVSEQTESDNRQIYLSPAQHLWAHILYDREHNTKTADFLLKLCGKSEDYFDCWEKCLAYSYSLSKKLFKKHSEQSLDKIGTKSREYWSYEANRQQLSNKLKEVWSDNELRKKQSVTISNLWNNDDYRQRQTNKLTEVHNDKTFRQQVSESVTELWKDDNYRDKHCGENHWNCSGKNNPMYGTISPVRGKHWYHNESESIMDYDCPEGFVPGRLMKKHC